MHAGPTLAYLKRSADLADVPKRLSFADNSANAEISADSSILSVNISESYAWSSHCSSVLSFTSQPSQMTLKIEKDSDGQKQIIRLSGRLRSEHLDELKTQMDGDQSRIVLDLDGVTLVDVEAVRFLNTCEKSGTELLHCWPYIREWIIREKDREA
jgi:hypothetical protein